MTDAMKTKRISPNAYTHDVERESLSLISTVQSVSLISTVQPRTGRGSRAGSHIQVTATATSVLPCPTSSLFGKSSPLPENEDEPGKEELGHVGVMLVSGILSLLNFLLTTEADTHT